jgi:hypothetical protein
MIPFAPRVTPAATKGPLEAHVQALGARSNPATNARGATCLDLPVIYGERRE